MTENSIRFYGAEWPCVDDAGAEKKRGSRSYPAHYMKMNTGTTVTIGAAADFDYLTDALDYYSGSILEQNLTFQLEEDIVVGESITISNFISAGGSLAIDTNGYTIVANCNSPLYFKECQGLSAIVKGAGTITSSHDGEATYLIMAQRVGHLTVQDANLAYTGDDTGYGIYFVNTDGTIDEVDTDDINPVDYTYRAYGGCVVGEDGSSESGGTGKRYLRDGAMAVSNTGLVCSEAGTLTPKKYLCL